MPLRTQKIHSKYIYKDDISSKSLFIKLEHNAIIENANVIEIYNNYCFNVKSFNVLTFNVLFVLDIKICTKRILFFKVEFLYELKYFL